MSTLLYPMGARPAVTGDIEQAQTTVTVVDKADPASVQDSMPDATEIATDPQTQGGLTTHQLASHVRPTLRGEPPVGNADDVNPAVDAMNNRIASAGVAAAQEAVGRWGHGTMKNTYGLSPALVDGTEMNETYFKAEDRAPNESSGAYMTPIRQPDTTLAAKEQADYAQRARNANAAMYQAFYEQRMAGQ